MDIGSGKGYPSASLSNFTPHPFVLDGVECASMEGFLQSLKFSNPKIQIEVCKLHGAYAKRRGSEKNKSWKKAQKLHWQGVDYDRHSDAYQELLDRAYAALAMNTRFRHALLATEHATLKHSIGRSKESETVLTKREFCSRLTKIREQIRSGLL